MLAAVPTTRPLQFPLPRFLCISLGSPTGFEEDAIALLPLVFALDDLFSRHDRCYQMIEELVNA